MQSDESTSRNIIIIEATSRRGCSDGLSLAVARLTSLFIELFDKRTNCRCKVDVGPGNKFKASIFFETSEAKEEFQQHPKYQESIIDIQYFSKPKKLLVSENINQL